MRLQMRFCKQKDYDNFVTIFKCYKEPIYILSRQCTSDYAISKGICCKVDVLFQFIMKYRQELYNNMKFVTLSDDDTFWRADQLLYWLSILNKANVSSTLPIVANGKFPIHTDPPFFEDNGIYNTDNCKEILTYGFYQPMVLNKIAFHKFTKVSESYGVSELCSVFTISQDVALGIVAWLTEMYRFRLSHVDEFVNEKSILDSYSTLMAIHHIKPVDLDDCDGLKWSDSMKYNQSLIIGCGDIDKQPLFHNISQSWTMYDLWNFFKDNNHNILLNDEDWDINIDEDGNHHYQPRLSFLYGYNSTKHYRENKILDKWKVYNFSDCEIPGGGS